MRFSGTLLALAVGVSALTLGSTAFAADKIKVVASFSILGDMVGEIGGDHVELTTLVGPDGDAHVYEPTPSDVRAVGAAQLLVVNGLEFEGWMTRLVGTAGFKGTEVTATDGIAPIPFAAEAQPEHAHESEAEHDHAAETEDGHHHGANDPHAWQDLANGVVYAENIVIGLAKVDPENAADYRARGDAFISQIKAMDAEVKAELAAVPADRRKAVTSHDAFGYFAKAYSVNFVAPEGVSTESEASASDVAKIIDQIRHEDITAVFVENVSDPRLIDRIASETGARIGGTLYSDALSGADGPAATYLGMFRNNVDQIVKALKTS
jgi:zinc/manganese transport system substrate-binding protein